VVASSPGLPTRCPNGGSVGRAEHCRGKQCGARYCRGKHCGSQRSRLKHCGSEEGRGKHLGTFFFDFRAQRSGSARL